MKKTFGTQLNEVAESVRMSVAEKARIRAALITKMHPERVRVVELETLNVPEEADYTSNSYVSRKPVRSSWGWLAGLRFAPATLALFGMVGAGVTFASEEAVPGDFLYPVKVNITEEVRAVLSFSEEARAEWETRRAERRLEEAEELATTGRLDMETGAQIAGAFERHTDSARMTLERLRDEDVSGAALAIGSRFETALSAHHTILSHIAIGASATSGSSEIAERVRIKAGEIAGMRIDAVPIASIASGSSLMMATSEEQSDDTATATNSSQAKVSSTAVARIKSVAEEQLRSTEKTFASVVATLDAEARKSAEAEIAAAQKLYTDGSIALEAGKTGEAARLYDQASMRAHKIELYLQAQMRLKINLFGGSGLFGGAATTSTLESEESTSTPSINDDREEVVDSEKDGAGSAEGDADIEAEVPLEL